MSRCEIYSISNNGNVELYAEERNACAGALVIWMDLAEKYGINCNVLDFNPVWSFCNNFKMERSDTIAMVSTYDRVWVAKEHLNEVAEAWENVWKYVDSKVRQYGKTDDTIRRVAVVLRRASEDENIRGICFNHTSVNSNPWQIRIDEDESRPFNFDTDTELDSKPIWELYDYMVKYDADK